LITSHAIEVNQDIAGQAAAAPGTLSTASVNFGNGTGEIVFNHTAANYVFAPAISSSGTGTGTVRVEAGTTILTATDTYAGPTMIDGGTLLVDGSIARSVATVNAGGALGGNGTIGNTVINGGLLAPGNSIGLLLTVQGNLSFTAASSYMIEIAPVNVDRVNVTGAATLGGWRTASRSPQRSMTRSPTLPAVTPARASLAIIGRALTSGLAA
jgi:autotransporter-associated beta strand protein